MRRVHQFPIGTKIHAPGTNPKLNLEITGHAGLDTAGVPIYEVRGRYTQGEPWLMDETFIEMHCPPSKRTRK